MLRTQLNAIASHHALRAVTEPRRRPAGFSHQEARTCLGSLAADCHIKHQLLNHARGLEAVQFAQGFIEQQSARGWPQAGALG